MPPRAPANGSTGKLDDLEPVWGWKTADWHMMSCIFDVTKNRELYRFKIFKSKNSLWNKAINNLDTKILDTKNYLSEINIVQLKGTWFSKAFLMVYQNYTLSLFVRSEIRGSQFFVKGLCTLWMMKWKFQFKTQY